MENGLGRIRRSGEVQPPPLVVVSDEGLVPSAGGDDDGQAGAVRRPQLHLWRAIPLGEPEEAGAVLQPVGEGLLQVEPRRVLFFEDRARPAGAWIRRQAQLLGRVTV